MNTDTLVTRSGSALRWIITGATLVFLLAPAIVVVLLSFSNDNTLSFPPQEWGFDRYISIFTSGRWERPIIVSLQLASVTAIATMVLVLPAAFAVRRGRLRWGGMLENLSLLPLVAPISAFAVALYIVYAQFRLTGSFLGVVLAHVILAIPMVIIIVGGSLDQISTDLELAAMTMGASRMRAWAGITGRLLTPAIVAGLLFGFVTSLDEAVLITFLGGAGLVSLPKYILDSVMLNLDPAITAVSTLFMASTTIIMLAALALRRR